MNNQCYNFIFINSYRHLLEYDFPRERTCFWKAMVITNLLSISFHKRQIKWISIPINNVTLNRFFQFRSSSSNDFILSYFSNSFPYIHAQLQSCTIIFRHPLSNSKSLFKHDFEFIVGKHAELIFLCTMHITGEGRKGESINSTAVEANRVSFTRTSIFIKPRPQFPARCMKFQIFPRSRAPKCFIKTPLRISENSISRCVFSIITAASFPGRRKSEFHRGIQVALNSIEHGNWCIIQWIEIGRIFRATIQYLINVRPTMGINR